MNDDQKLGIGETDQWLYRYWLDQVQIIVRAYEGVPPGLPWLEHWRAG